MEYKKVVFSNKYNVIQSLKKQNRGTGYSLCERYPIAKDTIFVILSDFMS